MFAPPPLLFVAEGVNESSALHLHISLRPRTVIFDRPLAMVNQTQQNESKLNYTRLNYKFHVTSQQRDESQQLQQA